MKKILYAFALMFSMCANDRRNSTIVAQTTHVPKSYYSKNVHDSTIYIGINQYHISPYNIDSTREDTAVVVRSYVDSITMYVHGVFFDYILKEWFPFKTHFTFNLNDSNSYKYSNMFSVNFINEDSIHYALTLLENPYIETYKYRGKKYTIR